MESQPIGLQPGVIWSPPDPILCCLQPDASVPGLQPDAQLTSDDYDMGCSVHCSQPDIPLDKHFGVEYAVVSLAPCTGVEYAPDCVGAVLPIERGQPDHHLTQLHWKRINKGAELKFYTHNRRCDFWLTPVSNTSWPFTFMMQWPNTLGLWQLSCANSKKWGKSYLLLRSFRLGTIPITMTNEGLVPIANSPRSQTTIVGRMFSGREVLRHNFDMETPVYVVLRIFLLMHQIPDHKKRSFQFLFENLKKPLRCSSTYSTTLMGMQRNNYVNLWRATHECLPEGQRGLTATALTYSDVSTDESDSEGFRITKDWRQELRAWEDGLQPSSQLGTTSGACNQTNFANESVIGSGPERYCLQNFACSSHYRGN